MGLKALIQRRRRIESFTMLVNLLNGAKKKNFRLFLIFFKKII